MGHFGIVGVAVGWRGHVTAPVWEAGIKKDFLPQRLSLNQEITLGVKTKTQFLLRFRFRLGPVLVYWVCSWLTCDHGMIQILENRSGPPKCLHLMHYVGWMIWDNATKKQTWPLWKWCKGLFNDIYVTIIESHCHSPIKTFSMYLKVILILYQVWRYYVLQTLRIFKDVLTAQHRDNNGQKPLLAQKTIIIHSNLSLPYLSRGCWSFALNY